MNVNDQVNWRNIFPFPMIVNLDALKDLPKSTFMNSYTQQFPTLFDYFLKNLPLAVAMLDKQRQYLAVSEQWLQIYGLEKSQVMGNICEQIAPDLGENCQEFTLREEMSNIVACPWRDEHGEIGGLILIKELLGATVVEQQLGQLEPQVEADTRQLQQTITQLQEEILRREKTEILLRESETRYQTLTQIAPVGIFQTDASGKCLYANDRWLDLAGMTQAENLGDGWAKAIHPDDRQNVFQTWQQAIENDLPYQVEFRLLHGDQTIVWVLAHALAEKNYAGEVIGFVGSVTNISDRKLMEASLRSNEARYRAIVEDQTELICRFLDDGKITFVNNAYCRCFGIERETAIGQIFLSLIPPEEFTSAQQHLASLNREQPVTTIECPVITSNQEIRWYLWTIRLLFEDNNLPEFQAVGRDITERKQAEEARRQSEEKFRNLAQREELLNQLTHQIRQSLDLDTILETTVQEIRNLLQLDRCQFSWYRTQAEPPRLDIVKESALPTLPSLIGSYPVTRSSVSSLERLLNRDLIRIDHTQMLECPEEKRLLLRMGYSSLLALPIENSVGDIGIVSCISCTEIRPWTDPEVDLLEAVCTQVAIAINQAELFQQTRKTAQVAQAKTLELEAALRDLQKAQSQLIQSEKMSSLGQLVAGIAHEINNPVSFIYGNIKPAQEYANSLLQLINLYQKTYPHPSLEIIDAIEDIELDFLAGDLYKLLDSMKIGAERIQEIVLSLRIFSRLDEAQMKAVNIHEGIESTLMILNSRTNANQYRPEIKIFKNYGKLPLVECYPGLLNQVFMNLISNAIDALDEAVVNQHITTSPIILIRTEVKEDDHVVISIVDNGIGIEESIQSRLFDPFFTTKPVGSGTGLGLSISYQIIVEKHGGKLTCFSILGQGAELTIEIPLKPHQNQSTAVQG